MGNWRKSTYSGANGGSCIEVATDGNVLVRDTTQNGMGIILSMPASAWTTFLSSLKLRECPSLPGRLGLATGVIRNRARTERELRRNQTKCHSP